MAYTTMQNDVYIASIPAVTNENDRAIREDRIVDAGKLNGLVAGNANGNIPVNNGTLNVNCNVEKLGGNLASAFATAGHTHAVATTSSNGFISNTDKTKLDSIATGAEVNQNSFANILINGTTIQADNKTDTLEIVAGTNINVSPDATNDKLTISLVGKVASASNADYATSASNSNTVNGYAIGGSGASNTVVVRDASGYIQNTWFNSNRGSENTPASQYIYDTGDGYMRKKDLANVRAEILAGQTLPANGGNADTVGGKTFNWSGQSGQPSWLWGGNDANNMYVYNPSNFNVNYANSAGSVPWSGITGSKPSGSNLVVDYTVSGMVGVDQITINGLDLLKDGAYKIIITAKSHGAPAKVLNMIPSTDTMFVTNNFNGYIAMANYGSATSTVGSHVPLHYLPTSTILDVARDWVNVEVIIHRAPNGRVFVRSYGFCINGGWFFAQGGHVSNTAYANVTGLTFFGTAATYGQALVGGIAPNTNIKIYRM